MITLKEYLEAINYRITEGSDFGWDCYGPDARYLDANGDNLNQDYSIHAIFDSKNQFVYALEAWDYRNDREYRWIHPDYKAAHAKECKKNNVDPKESMERNYIDLDVPEDILEKISAIVNDRDYDTRVKVPVNFTDEELLTYMKLAHDRDMTFNELVEEALLAAIEEFDRDPEGMRAKAERFKNERY